MLKIRNRKLYRGETCAYKGAQRERVIEEEREERRRRGGGGERERNCQLATYCTVQESRFFNTSWGLKTSFELSLLPAAQAGKT